MELMMHDWRSFQGMFYRQRRQSTSTTQPDASGPAYVVAEGNQVLVAYSENENLAAWSGSPVERLTAESGGQRPVVKFDRETVDRLLLESLSSTDFYEQVETYREGVTPKGSASKALHQHFLLEAIHGWWSKVLPSAYGVYVSVEGEPQESLLLVVRRGKFEGFFEPDLSFLNSTRREDPADTVKYLSEKYLVPVQGIFVPKAEWEEWSKNENPWKDVVRSVKANRTKMVPFRMSLLTMMTTRAFFKV